MNQIEQKETDLLKVVSDWLSWKHIVHWRQNSGAKIRTFEDERGRLIKRYIRFVRLLYPKNTRLPKDRQYKFPDLAGIHVGFYWVMELKLHKNSRIDKAQDNFLDLIRENGGFAAKVKMLEDAQALIFEIEKLAKMMSQFDLRFSQFKQ